MENIDKTEALYHLGTMLASERALRVEAEQKADAYHDRLHELERIIAHLRSTETMSWWAKTKHRWRLGERG